MQILVIVILTVLTFVAVTYLIIVSRFHSNKLPQLAKEAFQSKSGEINKILFIFPHPDDETFAAGGLIHKLSKDKQFEVHVIAATHGEKGTELVNKPPQELAPMRRQEFETAMKHLETNVYELWNYPDGNLEAHAQDLKTQLNSYIRENQIGTVITFERTGLYSHPDHIKLAEIVKEITEGEVNLQALYVSLPANIRNKLKFPQKITLDGQDIPLNSLQPDEPEAKVAVFTSTLARIRAAKAYKSQNVPKGLQLLWFASVFGVYEYYSTVWDKQDNAK